ncbi:Mu transposase domain-containing protein [Streptomyces massasporeus]
MVTQRHLRYAGKDCLVAFDANLYSVPARKVRPRQLVEVRATKSQISLHATMPNANGQTLLATHQPPSCGSTHSGCSARRWWAPWSAATSPPRARSGTRPPRWPPDSSPPPPPESPAPTTGAPSASPPPTPSASP